MDKDEDFKLVNDAIQTLSEHFDSVQVFVTRHESNDIGTRNINKGAGNWFSRYGQISVWLTKRQEEERCDVRKDNGDD